MVHVSTPARATEVGPTSEPVERYEVVDRRLVRRVLGSDGCLTDTDFGPAPDRLLGPEDLHAIADHRFLRETERPTVKTSGPPVTVVDLFSGVGALSLGVFEAARALGLSTQLGLAADLEQAPLDVLTASLGTSMGAARRIDLGAALSGSGQAKPTPAERALLRECPDDVDILVAGPPCQGHSRLNNHTRHDDPRNDLYACVARFVAIKRPRLCIIENVDSVVHDQRRSTACVADQLRQMSYRVDTGTVALHDLGVAQTRRRHVMVAVRADHSAMRVHEVVGRYSVDVREARTLRWAISDLQYVGEPRSIDVASNPTSINRERIDWLHDSEEYNLPNARRPDCHRVPKVLDTGDGREHSYKSMYGRLRWDKPAQTITSGYGSMGQGRYVHPGERRTLTPHEAARLQFLPDFLEFEVARGRGTWARMIGNAAPLKLSYVFALDFLR